MKRHPHLHGLSSDHHQALVLARRCLRVGGPDGAAGPQGAAEREAVWTEVQRRYVEELRPHFDEEERDLLPLLREGGRPGLAERTLAEHAALRSAVEANDPDPGTRLVRFGRLLRAHVRFEERLLFPALEKLLEPEGKGAVETAGQL